MTRSYIVIYIFLRVSKEITILVNCDRNRERFRGNIPGS